MRAIAARQSAAPLSVDARRIDKGQPVYPGFWLP